MDILKRLIIESEVAEAYASVDDFIKENGIENDSIIHSLLFSKHIFLDKAEAIDWVSTHGFSIDNINENDDSIEFVQINECDLTDVRNVNIRNGIIASYGELRQHEMPFTLDSGDSGYKFSESLPQMIELAKVVDGHHVNYGKVSITEEMLKSFKDNFDNKAVGVDIMIDFDHKQSEAAGWIKEVMLSYDETTLFGVIRWTEKGAQALSSRTFRYISPEFTSNYIHPHTGIQHGPTLLGGGLVNRPFLKMDAIVTFSEKTNNNQDEVINVEKILLSEHNEKVVAFEGQIAEFKLSEEKAKNIIDGQKNEIAAKTEENVKLSEELKAIKEDSAKKELESKHSKLFSENKINKAQLDALNEGKDMLEVLALSAEMNVDAKGSTVETASTIQFSDADKAAMKLFGQSPEDYAKYNGLI